MDDTVTLTFWVTGFVFVVVNLFMAYCVWRYRHRKGNSAHYEPESKKLEGALILATTVGVVAMLAPGLLAWAKFVDVPKDAAVFEVVARQWNFNYRFPGADGVLGTVDARFVSDANPFGINPADPKGQDDILISSPELHLPMGKSVKAELRSIDVLHDFTVPQFRAKMNMVPGLVTYVWFTPTRVGKFDAFCDQLCGVAHYAMRGRVVVAYIKTLPDSTAPHTVDTNAANGQQLYETCAACHGADGRGAQATHAPRLKGMSDWYMVNQLKNFQQGTRGTHPKDLYGPQMAALAAMLTSDREISDLVAYINTLK